MALESNQRLCQTPMNPGVDGDFFSDPDHSIVEKSWSAAVLLKEYSISATFKCTTPENCYCVTNIR